MENREVNQKRFNRLPRRVGRELQVLAIIALVTVVPVMSFWNAKIVSASPNGRGIEIRVLSSRPDMVSGGTALLEIHAPNRFVVNDLRLSLNGKIVTNDFHPQTDGTFIGLAQGLVLGQNHFIAATKQSQWRPVAQLEITNHSIRGPIFSGTHQAPFICETSTFALPVTGSTLGPPLDSDCSIATRVDYLYRSKDGNYKPLSDPTSRPPDLTQTVTTEGRKVNYIVRVETGTINRAIYQIAILQDPMDLTAPTPWTQLAGWNGRLVYFFGGGCRPGYHQGNSFVTGGPVDDVWLSKGYAAAASSLNVFDNNCNDVVSAETMMMVKEHFIKQYGVPRYTMGWGASGGSMQQQLISANYPGLLDGITPSLSFPDAITFFTPIADCALLVRAFSGSTTTWSAEQKAAVGGWGTWEFCTEHRTADWSALFRSVLNPEIQVTGCRSSVPVALIYDPLANPTGVRCSWFDNSVNVFGRDPKTGFALRTLDNVGVQYGLLAFNAGQITAEQFLDLNEKVGGYDADGNIVASRTVADTAALRIAYESGRVNEGGELKSVPIIDYRPYRDLIADVHDSVRSHIMRARLIATNGGAANQVILVGPSNSNPSGTKVFSSMSSDVLRMMDRWLSNIVQDKSPYKRVYEKVVRNKPTELVDACYGVSGEKINDPAACGAMYPVHGNPRLAAGQPLKNDILKCPLKAVDVKDYSRPLSADQVRRLNAIFPQGVCDYSRPGIGQGKIPKTWIGYSNPGKFE